MTFLPFMSSVRPVTTSVLLSVELDMVLLLQQDRLEGVRGFKGLKTRSPTLCNPASPMLTRNSKRRAHIWLTTQLHAVRMQDSNLV